MKQKMMRTVSKCWLAIMAVFFNVVAFAQDKGLDVNVDINKGGGNMWYSNPWVWIVGAAVFILLLVAIVRGGGRTSD